MHNNAVDNKSGAAPSPAPPIPFMIALAFMAASPAGCMEDEPQAIIRRCTDPGQLEKYAATRPDLPLVRQTEHLDIYADKGWSVCAGTAIDLERHVVSVADTLGIEDLRTHIPFYYTYDLPDQCKPTSIGCLMPDGAAYGIAGTTYHELTHAVACQLNRNAASSFTEGLASMFRQYSHGHESYAYAFDGDIADLLVATPTNYTYSAHFLRWLIQREGGPAFAEVYTGSRGYPPPEIEEVATLLDDVYGMDVTELASAYAVEAPFAWRPLRQCADLRHVEAQQGEWHFEGVLDCNNELTLGPNERDKVISVEYARMTMHQSFTFTVETPGRFAVEISGAHSVSFERCAERDAQTPEEASWLFKTNGAFANPELPTDSVELTPGLWRADVEQWQTHPGPFDVVIYWVEDLPPWAALP